ncbi:MAG: multidrug resistance efflux transporter family protein [Desulfuromusa sp.]|jgi:drug/metabolite transporter (DMT)-like permease|nr:multidrug resistance efflux transporter family protein [Desulfuromusa sp.]
MFRLISLGIVSALFFSSTFILNRAMSLDGGHWFWTAALRYAWMLALLVAWLLISGKTGWLKQAFQIFCKHWLFWILTGSIGFGVFYSLISFSASYAPGWVVATTWQTTILASPLILLLFGKKIPVKAVIYIFVISMGILMVNLGMPESISLQDLLLGGLPVLIAAFAYPLGNQILWEAQRNGTKLIPRINDPLLNNPFIRILLLTLGTVPFWLVLYLMVSPPPPSTGQFINTALVALFSGIIATSLFLHARHQANNSYEIAAIDSTQSSEVIFSLLGEILFLHGLLPGLSSGIGVILTVVGLAFYMRSQVSGS